MATGIKIKENINKLPDFPGVYIFKDKDGKELYIGKAENIKKRVRSHFRMPDISVKDAILTKKTLSIDYLVTRNAVEALILECNLIKEHKPRYNILLKDDKSYPYIKISLGEIFPAVYITRDLNDKQARHYYKGGQAKYFGPYTDTKSLRRTLLLLQRIFLFKTCKKIKIDGKPCLNYHISRCIGPCAGKISREDYMEIIRNVSLFLEGKTQHLLSELKKRMVRASASKEYEKAGKIRDQIESIRQVSFPQVITKFGGKNQDFIGLAQSKGKALVALLKVKSGKLLAQEKFALAIKITSREEEVIETFIEQYYSSCSLSPDEFCRAGIPDEIFLPVVLKEKELLEEWFKKSKGKTVKISVPQRGANKKLLKMASDNARYKLFEDIASKSKCANLSLDLQKILNLPSAPVRVEGIDISNIRGKSAVGSVVVFDKGLAAKNNWRRFKIKSIDTSDDYMMMREVLTRRYKRMLEENKLPDLVLVDGGKGQVSIAKQVFERLGAENIPIIGIAKPVKKFISNGSRGENKIHLSYSSRTIILNPRVECFRFLARVRDEAHRFAHSYYLKLRKKELK